MVGDSESVKVTDEINTNSENKKSVEDFNPFDNPIAKALAKRTEERKQHFLLRKLNKEII